MGIDRIISPVLRKAARQLPVVILSGARQCGKTSLLRHLWPGAGYVTFDLPLEAKAAVLPRADDLRGCHAFAADQGAKAILRAAVVCRTPAPTPLDASPARQAIGLTHLAAWIENRPTRP